MTIEEAKKEYPIGAIVYYRNFNGTTTKAQVVGYEKWKGLKYYTDIRVYYFPIPGKSVTKTINPRWIYKVCP